MSEQSATVPELSKLEPKLPSGGNRKVFKNVNRRLCDEVNSKFVTIYVILKILYNLFTGNISVLSVFGYWKVVFHLSNFLHFLSLFFITPFLITRQMRSNRRMH